MVPACGHLTSLCGMVWYGMIWYGPDMVWYGMVWYSMVWYGMEVPYGHLYRVMIGIMGDHMVQVCLAVAMVSLSLSTMYQSGPCLVYCTTLGTTVIL